MTHIQEIEEFDKINWDMISLVTNRTDFRYLLGDFYTIVSEECKSRFLKQNLKNENNI